MDTIYQTLDGLKDIKPDFISVTFGAGGSQVNQSTREIAAIIQKQYHIPAMAHLTCITATRGEVTELLYDLKADGVENVLALRGDRNPDYPPKDGVPPRRRAGGLHPPAGGTSVCPPPVTLRGTRRAPTR